MPCNPEDPFFVGGLHKGLSMTGSAWVEGQFCIVLFQLEGDRMERFTKCHGISNVKILKIKKIVKCSITNFPGK